MDLPRKPPNGIDWYTLYLAYARGHLTYQAAHFGQPQVPYELEAETIGSRCPYDVAHGAQFWYWWAGWMAAARGGELVEYGYWRWCWESAMDIAQ